jgi:hypothetical protein
LEILDKSFNPKPQLKENVINFYTGELISHENPVLIDNQIAKNLKKELNFSFLSPSDYILKEMQVPKIQDPEDLKNYIKEEFVSVLKEDINNYSYCLYNKMDLLDTNNQNDNNDLFDDDEVTLLIFVANTSKIEKKFKKLSKKIKYIDFLIPISVLLNFFYRVNNRSLITNDIFIYLDKYEVTLLVFSRGYETVNRKIDFSLLEFAQRFLQKNDISEEEFIKFSQEITDFKNPELSIESKQALAEIYSEFFEKINSELEKLESEKLLIDLEYIFFFSYIGKIKGLDEFSETYFNKKSYNELYLSENFPLMEHGSNQFLVLISDLYRTFSDVKFNSFDIFQKPAPFLKRPSGKLISWFALSLFFASAIPVYDTLNYILNSIELESLKQKDKILSKEYNLIKSQLSILLAKKEKLDKELKETTLSLQSYEKLIDNINKQQHGYNLKAEIIYIFSEFIVKNNVIVEEILYSEKKHKKQFVFKIKGQKEEFITALIHDLTKSIEYKIEVEKIFLDLKNSYYFADLKVILD